MEFASFFRLGVDSGGKSGIIPTAVATAAGGGENRFRDKTVGWQSG